MAIIDMFSACGAGWLLGPGCEDQEVCEEIANGCLALLAIIGMIPTFRRQLAPGTRLRRPII
eukprot:11577270-Heterocapsa_arctica.AAC.1